MIVRNEDVKIVLKGKVIEDHNEGDVDGSWRSGIDTL